MVAVADMYDCEELKDMKGLVEVIEDSIQKQDAIDAAHGFFNRKLSSVFTITKTKQVC